MSEKINNQKKIKKTIKVLKIILKQILKIQNKKNNYKTKNLHLDFQLKLKYPTLIKFRMELKKVSNQIDKKM